MPPSLPPQTAQQLQDLTRVVTSLTLALQHTASYEAHFLSHNTRTLFHQNQHALPSLHSLHSQAQGVQRQADALFTQGKRMAESIAHSAQPSPSSHSSSTPSPAGLRTNPPNPPPPPPPPLPPPPRPPPPLPLPMSSATCSQLSAPSPRWPPQSLRCPPSFPLSLSLMSPPPSPPLCTLASLASPPSRFRPACRLPVSSYSRAHRQ